MKSRKNIKIQDVIKSVGPQNKGKGQKPRNRAFSVYSVFRRKGLQAISKIVDYAQEPR